MPASSREAPLLETGLPQLHGNGAHARGFVLSWPPSSGWGGASCPPSLELACTCPARFSEGVGHHPLNTAHQGWQEGGESTETWNPDQNFERLMCVAPSGALAKRAGVGLRLCMSYELQGRPICWLGLTCRSFKNPTDVSRFCLCPPSFIGCNWFEVFVSPLPSSSGSSVNARNDQKRGRQEERDIKCP